VTATFDNPKSTGRGFIGVILLIALALRLGWALSRPVSPDVIESLPDQQQYLQIAQNVLNRQGYWFLDPRVRDRVYAFRTPGYPLFVAACGANVRIVRGVQAVIDASTVAAIYWLGMLLFPAASRRSHSRTQIGGAQEFPPPVLRGRVREGVRESDVGSTQPPPQPSPGVPGEGEDVPRPRPSSHNSGPLIAALLVAFNPFLLYFCGLILSETLFTSMLVWGMAMLVAGKGDGVRKPRTLLWLAGGLTLALSVLVRPSAVLMPLVLGIGSMFVNRAPQGSYQLRWPLPVGATMLLLTGLVLAPWAIRNHQVLGQWVLLETNSGFTLYDGYNPDATGASNQRFVMQMPQLSRMSEIERSRYLEELAFDAARKNPRRTIDLARAKLVRTWSPMPLSDQYSGKMYQLIGLCYSLPLDLLVLWGLASGNLSRGAKVLVLLPAIYLSGVHMLTVGSLRYRIPAEPPLALLAACALVNVRTPARMKNENS
jgi:hypothetical protein